MRRFSALIRNLSVSWKFILAYYAVLIVPMAFFGVYFYMRASDDSISQAKLVMERNLLQTRASIMQKVKLIENISQIITSDGNVQSVFYYDYENENDRLKDFQFNISPMLSNISRQNSLIYAIRIYTSRTLFTSMSDSYYSIRKKDSPKWYEEALSTMPLEEGWVASHKSVGNALRSLGNTSEQVFSYSGNILSPVSKESIGLAEIEVKENLLLDMLRDPVISKWGKVFVADYNGVIVSNNILPMYKTNVSSLGFDDYNASEQLNKIEKLENKKSILIAIPIEDIGCSIIGIFPVENFNADARGSIMNLHIVLAVLSILLGMIIYSIYKYVAAQGKKTCKSNETGEGQQPGCICASQYDG